MLRYLWIIALPLFTPQFLWAHALGAECSLKNGVVLVEAFFDDDSPAVNALVDVQSSQEKSVAAGKTNAKGLWSFPAPAAGDYVLTVDAGMGHKKRVPFSVPATSPASDSPAASGSEQHTRLSKETREEFTRFPYLNVGLGVGGIFLFSMAYLAARRKGRGH